MEAVLTELFLSGEVERNYGLLRTEGFVKQLEHHSPTSHYGQLSRRGRYDGLDFSSVLQEIVQHIATGKFADEWEAEAAGEVSTVGGIKGCPRGRRR
jgi:ketol-acid reductoisomerase